MSGSGFNNQLSLMEEIDLLVKGNEDLRALISKVLHQRRTFSKDSIPAEASSSTERPKQLLMASSTESCAAAVPPDELSMCSANAIEGLTTKSSNVVLIEGSPLSNPYGMTSKFRAYEGFADDEASYSDDSSNSFASWLAIQSSDGDSKYHSTSDDDYEDSSLEESGGSRSTDEVSSSDNTNSTSGKNRYYEKSKTDSYDGKSNHFNSSTESYSESDYLQRATDEVSSSDNTNSTSGKNRYYEKSKIDSYDGKSNHFNSSTESYSESDYVEISSDNPSESDEKSSDESKTVDLRGGGGKAELYSSSAESNGEVEVLDRDYKSKYVETSSDDSGGKSTKSPNAVDSSDGESERDSYSTESDSEIEVLECVNKSEYVEKIFDISSKSDGKALDKSKEADSCDGGSKHYSTITESDSDVVELENTNDSVDTISIDSKDTDENSLGSSKVVGSSDDESNHYSSTKESNVEADHSSDNDTGNSETGSTESDEESTDERPAVDNGTTEENDSSEDSESDGSGQTYDSESSDSTNEAINVDSESETTDLSRDSSASLDSFDIREYNEKSGKKPRGSPTQFGESGESDEDDMWIEPRRRRLSDWGESSLIQSDSPLVCMKTGKDKIIISKRNRIGEIQAIYFFPHFLEWRGSSSSKNESDSKVASSSSDESESPEEAAGLSKKNMVGEKSLPKHRRSKLQMVDKLKALSLYLNLNGTVHDSTTSDSTDKSADNTESSPSYKKYPSVSEDLSPSIELGNDQKGPLSHTSNTYRKFKDVDGRM